MKEPNYNGPGECPECGTDKQPEKQSAEEGDYYECPECGNVSPYIPGTRARL